MVSLSNSILKVANLKEKWGGVALEVGSRSILCVHPLLFLKSVVLHWTHGTPQFSLHENGYHVCIFPPWNLFWKKNKCLLNGNRNWRGFSETTIIEKVWVSLEEAVVASVTEVEEDWCWKAPKYLSWGRKGTQCWKCLKLWARQGTINTQRIRKMAFVFSYLGWSPWPAYFL